MMHARLQRAQEASIGLPAAAQLGTFVHELGHNLNLLHNGNDHPNLALRSVIHESVMNYRYQFLGVPTLPAVGGGGNGRHTYSVGPNTQCAPCTTSAKHACSLCQTAGTCSTDPACVSCDCDVAEWSVLKLDLFNDPDGDYLDGAPVYALPRIAAPGRLKAQDVPQFVASADHVEPPGLRISRARAKVDVLEARGLERGRDFHVSADGDRVYVLCP